MMIVLKNVEQFNEIFKKLTKDGSAKIEDIDSFVNLELDEDKLISLSSNIDCLVSKSQEVEDFSMLVFQLRNFIPALSNFMKMLLISKNYEAVYVFVSKLFGGQIGNIKYTSVCGPYTFSERYFDRFVEIVKNCKIKPDLYLPLVLETFKQSDNSLLIGWKRPALEFLQNFWTQNEEWMLTYMSHTGVDLKYDILENICSFNTNKGIMLLVNDYISGVNFNEDKNIHVLKNYKKDTLPVLDKKMFSADAETKQKLCQIYFAFLPDNEVFTRLKDMYEDEKDEEIKSLIASRLGITDTLSIKSEKQFLYAVRRKIKEPQERALGIPFDRIDLKLKSGFASDNSIFSFLIYLLKEEKNLANIKKLLVLNDIFEKEGLISFARKMFDVLSSKDDILQAKWAIRFYCLFCDESLLNDVLELDQLLFEYERNKEANYLTECLISAGKDKVLDLLKNLLDKNNAFAVEKKEYYAQLFSSRNDISIEEVNDCLILDKESEQNEEEQKERLFEAFINARQYSENRFKKLFLENKFLSSLASKLVWGEYNFGRLYNAFIIENGEKKYIVKTLDLDQKVIEIIHSLDLDTRFDAVLNAIDKPLFEQLKMYPFDLSTFPKMSTNTNRFAGIFVSISAFVSSLEKYGFVVNNYDEEIYFSSLIFNNQELGIIAEIEFEGEVQREQNFATLGSIYFYRQNDVIVDKGKHLTTRSNAISLGGVPYRFFDYVLSAVSNSAKAK